MQPNLVPGVTIGILLLVTFLHLSFLITHRTIPCARWRRACNNKGCESFVGLLHPHFHIRVENLPESEAFPA